LEIVLIGDVCRLLTVPTRPLGLPISPSSAAGQGEFMLETEPSKKVTIHIGEDHTYHGKAAFIAICAYLGRKRISEVHVTRGIAGFGADHRMHTIAIERLTEDLPTQIEFVAPLQKIDEVMPELYDMAGTGLIEVQDTFLPLPARAGEPPSETSVNRKGAAKAQLMRVFVGENDT
jgi:PII-like signaling protein